MENKQAIRVFSFLFVKLLFFKYSSLITGSTFTLAMVNGDDLTLSELALQSTVRKTVGTVTTLVLSGFCEYHAGESVSFRIYSESDGGYLVTPGGKMSIHYIGSTQTAPAFLVQVDNDYNVTSLGGEIVKPYVSSGRAKLFAYLTGILFSHFFVYYEFI